MKFETILGYFLFGLTIYIYVLGYGKKEDFKQKTILPFIISILVMIALSVGLSFTEEIQNKYLNTDLLSFTFVSFIPVFFLFIYSKTHVHRKIYATVGGIVLRTGVSRVSSYALSFFPFLNLYLNLILAFLIIIMAYIPIRLFITNRIAHDDSFIPSKRNIVILIILSLVGLPCAYIESFVSRDIFFYTYYVIFELLFFFVVSFLQYYLYLSYRQALTKEYEKELIRERLEQYDNLQEVINVMNIKAHDLKHQIKDIKEKNQIDSQVVDDLNKVIDEYNSTIKTGYELLDSLLTQKKYLCLSKQAALNIIIDEKYFRFFTTEELKNFIGNALDNAIEYIASVEDVEKRYIGLKTIANEYFFKIIVENYCEDDIKFDKNGFPISKKKDRLNHGFGTRSIARICKKYGGEINYYYENNTFSLIALFPISLIK